MAALLGYERDDLIGRNGWSFTAGASVRERRRVERELAERGVASSIATLRHRTSKRLRFAYTIQRVAGRDKDGGDVILYVMIGRLVERGRPLPEPLLPVTITKQEAAAGARVSVRTIEREMMARRLEAGGPPGARRILFESYAAWLAGRGTAVLALAVVVLVVLALSLLNVVCLAACLGGDCSLMLEAPPT